MEKSDGDCTGMKSTVKLRKASAVSIYLVKPALSTYRISSGERDMRPFPQGVDVFVNDCD